MSDNTPEALLSLAREVLPALQSADIDTATFRATAGHRPQRDSIIDGLPSFAGAREALLAPPLVAERYGTDEGDRLALQFVYNLFPRHDARGLGADVRRVWRDYLAEVARPDWRFFGVANLRHLIVAGDVRLPVSLADGVSIRGRSSKELADLGFSDMTWEAISEDWSEGHGSSPYVIMVERRVPKSSANVSLRDSNDIDAQRAITALRLSAPGDISMGPMWWTRSAKFNVGTGHGALRSGWKIPAGGRTDFVLTQVVSGRARHVMPMLRQLEVNGYGKGAGNLDLALRSFLSTYDRFPIYADSQMVDTMTAAEALLGTETEASFRLAYRVAGLLGVNPTERSDIFRSMRSFYDARSKVVHGAALKGKQSRTLEGVDDARDYVRRLLVGFIRLAVAPSPSYDRKFFEQDLDAALQDEKLRRRLAAELKA